MYVNQWIKTHLNKHDMHCTVSYKVLWLLYCCSNCPGLPNPRLR